jgi:hypothetical protein
MGSGWSHRHYPQPRSWGPAQPHGEDGGQDRLNAVRVRLLAHAGDIVAGSQLAEPPRGTQPRLKSLMAAMTTTSPVARSIHINFEFFARKGRPNEAASLLLRGSCLLIAMCSEEPGGTIEPVIGSTTTTEAFARS